MKLKKPIIGLIFLLMVLFSFAILSSSFMTSAEGTIDGYHKYIVGWGDSLYSIGQKFGIQINDIKTANGLKTDMIIPGQVLRIPDNKSNIYVVRAQDTLFKISQKYGLKVNYLKWANSLKTDAIYSGQVLTIPGRDLTIVIDKSDHLLSLVSNGRVLRSYHVEFGDGGLGDKQISGDHKTPEGTFYVAEKSVLNPPDYYLGSRWLRVSYPNIEDANRGLQQDLINQQTYDSIVKANNNLQIPSRDTALGGGVGIHGGGIPEFGSDWTWGCIGLTNKAIEDFYNYINVGTKIIIRK